MNVMYDAIHQRKQVLYTRSHTTGFTIVELLIVIVIIAILAAITIVAYNGIQNRARNARVQSDIKQVADMIEMYAADNGSYPSTGGLSNVYEDSNCTFSVDADTTPGIKTAQWVPGLSQPLPQNPGLTDTGIAANVKAGATFTRATGKDISYQRGMQRVVERVRMHCIDG